jgi:hypothetical protein
MVLHPYLFIGLAVLFIVLLALFPGKKTRRSKTVEREKRS